MRYGIPSSLIRSPLHAITLKLGVVQTGGFISLPYHSVVYFGCKEPSVFANQRTPLTPLGFMGQDAKYPVLIGPIRRGESDARRPMEQAWQLNKSEAWNCPDKRD